MQYMMSIQGPEPSVGDVQASLSSVSQVSFRPESLVMSHEVSRAYLVVRCSAGNLRAPEERESTAEQILDGSQIVMAGQRVTMLVAPRKVPTSVRFVACLLGPVTDVERDRAKLKATLLGIS